MLTAEPTRTSPQLAAGGRGGFRMRALLHRNERSRFVLALTASIVIIGAVIASVSAASGLVGLTALTAVLVIFGLTVWLSVTIFRAHLLGHAARVSVDNLPEVQGVLTEVRANLRYHRPVDVYVIDKPESPAMLVKFLQTRVILLDGSLVADTLPEEKRAELTFLIARFIGALKAKHLRMQPFVIVVGALEKLGFLNPFLYPYERAIVYSGDQIGLVCCGNIKAALNVVGGLMVGTDLAPKLGTRGLLRQAVSVRRKWLTRLRQLFLTHPHLTNRYLNLLEFAARQDPVAFADFRAGLDELSRRDLDAILAGQAPADAASVGNGQRTLTPIAAVLTVVALLLAAVMVLRVGSPTSSAAPSSLPTPTSEIPATTAEAPATTEAPAPVELAGAASATASSTARNSVDAAGQPVTFAASNVTDGRTATAWRTPGDGRSETLTLSWDHTVRVMAVGLIPGYDKHDPLDGTDRFAQNRRIAAARILVDNGSAWEIELADSRQLQLFRIDPTDTTSVTIEILDSIPGHPGFNYAAISEVSVLGIEG